MDINTQNSSGMMNGMPPTIKEERKIGPIIGTLIIVILIIIAALYFFGRRLDNKQQYNSQQLQGIEDRSIPARNDASADTTNTSNVDNAALEAELDSQLKDIDSSF